MNKSELLEQLNSTWAKKSSTGFVFGLNGKTLTVDDLYLSLKDPKAKLPRYTHPKLKTTLALIQDFDPINIIQALFSAWGQGDCALILDPKLSAAQTQKRLKSWGLTSSSMRPCQKNNEALFIALATSGSSGTPKLIGLSAKQMGHSCRMAQQFLADSFPRSWGLSLPCWHIGGLMVIWRMLMTKGKVIELELKEKIPEQTWSELQALSLVPTQLQRLIDQNYSSQLSKLSLILLGGAACPQSLAQQSLTSNLPLYLSYGATETCSMIAAAKLTKSLSIKKMSPLPAVYLKTTAHQNLQISSPTLHSWRIEDQEVLVQEANSFFTTRDQAKLTGQGEFEILGRSDRTFISGGENVSAQKIENLLESFTLISQAQIIIRPDDEYGQVSHLYYQVSNNAGPDIETQLINFLKKKLQSFEIPKSLSPMPKYSTLKPPRSRWQDDIQQQYLDFQDSPGLLLIHGFMGVTDEFLPLKNALIEKGIPPWKIKTIRLPGHDGLTINEKATTQESLSIFSSELKKHLQTPQVIYAYSMGARALSMWLYHLHDKNDQNDIKGLILESGHPGGLNSSEANKRSKADAQIFDPQTVPLENFIQKWTKLPLFQGLNEQKNVPKLSRVKAKRHDPKQLYTILQALSVSIQPDMKNIWQDYSRSIPVLYLSGEKDHKYTQIGQDLQIRHQVHPWASHNIHLQDPEWCAKMIVKLLSQTKRLK